MDADVIECSPGEECCACGGGAGRAGAGLAVLRDVQRAYEQRMDMLDTAPASKKLRLQVELLRSWVGDLVGQNTLLTRVVEDLETEATTRLFMEQRKHSEMVCELRAELAVLRRRLARKDSDLRGLVEVLRRLRDFDYRSLDGIHFFEITQSDIFGGNFEWQQKKKLAQGDVQQKTKPHSEKDNKPPFGQSDKRNLCGKHNELKILNESLHKENCAKDREIRKLHKDAQQYEQTIMSLRSEISLSKYHSPDISKKDAEVMAKMCCTGAECGDWEPVKDFNSMLHEEMVSYQERIQKMEINLKASGSDVRSLRKVNVGLREELHALRSMCAALGEQCHTATMRGHFKDDIIREMRRQLKLSKAKSKEAAELTSLRSQSSSRGRAAYDAVDISCVRSQPRRSRGAAPPSPPPRSVSDEGRSPRLVLSANNMLSIDAE